ncbi:MAG TPA: hypothetical protein PLD27_12660 [bacterium]|nr:hypothetical protein [bacterium]
MKIKIILFILFFISRQIYSISDSEVLLIKKYFGEDDTIKFIQLYQISQKIKKSDKHLVVIPYNFTGTIDINKLSEIAQTYYENKKYKSLFSKYKNEIEYFKKKIINIIIEKRQKRFEKFEKLLLKLDNSSMNEKQKEEILKKVQLKNLKESNELETIHELIFNYTYPFYNFYDDKINNNEMKKVEIKNADQKKEKSKEINFKKIKKENINNNSEFFYQYIKFLIIKSKKNPFFLIIIIISIILEVLIPYFFLGFIFLIIFFIILENKKKEIKYKEIIFSYLLKSIIIIILLTSYNLILILLFYLKTIKITTTSLLATLGISFILIIINILAVYTSIKKYSKDNEKILINKGL